MAKETEKLQKVLARAGLGSRRQMEQWIEDARVKVNGRIATLGDRVDDRANIHVDDRPIRTLDSKQFATRVLLYHKPAGQVCTRHDPEGRDTVFAKLPKIKTGRWIAVGRLDYHTLGLLLFTNDGELANQLMHPSCGHEREYAVRIYGEISDDIIKNMIQGVELEDGPAKFEGVFDAGGEGKNHWYHVVIKEGRNRIVRRLWESQDLTVSRLIRVRYGNIQMPSNLRQGEFRELTAKDIKQLRHLTNITE